MTVARVLEGMPHRWPLLMLVATLALGATVAVSWIGFGGTDAWQGPDRVLERSWAGIYGSQALLAALIGHRLSPRIPSLLGLVAVVTGAWLGELVALTLFGNLLANEIDPTVAWVFWWMGTGGPVQPVAAVVGGLVQRIVSARSG